MLTSKSIIFLRQLDIELIIRNFNVPRSSKEKLAALRVDQRDIQVAVSTFLHSEERVNRPFTPSVSDRASQVP